MRAVLTVGGVVVAAVVCANSAQGGMVFCAWNFNGPKGTSQAATGAGVAMTLGGVSSTFSTGCAADDGATVPAENKGWNLAAFAAQGTASGERGSGYATSTAGYESVVVTWYERHSASSSRFTQLQYTIDGTSFTSEGLSENGIFEATLGADVWQAQRRVDLSTIAGVAGNSKFAVRMVSIFAPGTSAYAATGATANYSGAGTLRFDLVRVEGVAVPAPAVAALGAAGLAVAAAGSRKRE